jgi:hypothetical protein
MHIKVSEATPLQLDWLVAKCEGWLKGDITHPHFCKMWKEETRTPAIYPSTDWAQGGPIIERENITLIRANSQYLEGKNVPLWFAETDKWVGHNISTGYEGEYFDPCFMVDEAGGFYGPTPLIAAMRCFVASRLGDEVEIPEELK